MIIFPTAHLFEILSGELCFPLKVLVTDHMQSLSPLSGATLGRGRSLTLQLNLGNLHLESVD